MTRKREEKEMEKQVKMIKEQQYQENSRVNRDLQLIDLRKKFPSLQSKELELPEDIRHKDKVFYFGMTGEDPPRKLMIKGLSIVVGLTTTDGEDMLIGQVCPYCVHRCKKITAKMLWRYPGGLPRHYQTCSVKQELEAQWNEVSPKTLIDKLKKDGLFTHAWLTNGIIQVVNCFKKVLLKKFSKTPNFY